MDKSQNDNIPQHSPPMDKCDDFKAAYGKAQSAAKSYHEQTTDSRLLFAVVAIMSSVIGGGMLFDVQDPSPAAMGLWTAGLVLFALSAVLYVSYIIRVMHKTFDTVKTFAKYNDKHVEYDSAAAEKSKNEPVSPKMKQLQDELGEAYGAVKDYYDEYIKSPEKGRNLVFFYNIPTLLFAFYVFSTFSIVLFVAGVVARIISPTSM